MDRHLLLGMTVAALASPGPTAPDRVAPASPPTALDHAPIACLVADRHPRIEARLTAPPAASRGRVYFRARGTPSWYYVELRPSGEAGHWSATLPRPAASTAGVDYYLEIVG